MLYAELIYLAEQIAEEHGEDHVWVEQLIDLSEEVKELETGTSDITNSSTWTSMMAAMDKQANDPNNAQSMRHFTQHYMNLVYDQLEKINKRDKS